jgi:hypothetical protein
MRTSRIRRKIDHCQNDREHPGVKLVPFGEIRESQNETCPLPEISYMANWQLRRGLAAAIEVGNKIGLPT